ncbi:MAG: tetratricopeptide repeat protein [Ideonella sp.]
MSLFESNRSSGGKSALRCGVFSRTVVATMLPALIAIALVLAARPARAAIYQPQSDSEVVETLINTGTARSEERALRKRLVANPDDSAVAVALARRYLEQARDQGEPRFAGRALAVLQHWKQTDTAPAEVVLMLATVQQYLHDFDGSAALLEALVKRDPRQPQAWLTLATIRRVQGRYAESDAGCHGLAATGEAFYSQACLAENLALRGRFEDARKLFQRLLATPQLPAAPRSWLMTSVAELEMRAGRPREAEAGFRAALATAPDEYTRLTFADFLIANGRQAEVLPLLRNDVRSDPVLLRLALAEAALKAGPAAADTAELRARMVQAALRPEARTTHAREQAMFALFVDGDPQRALQLARKNVELQREPVDLILLAQVARAAGSVETLAQARKIKTDMGLSDARLDALL